MDVRELVTYTDYLVVCSGQTPRQVAAIADEVRFTLKNEHGVIAHRVDGEAQADWVLIDFLDIVVHVFTPEAREFYRLERVWHDAPREEVAAAS
jgi:ribosome-associated protein